MNCSVFCVYCSRIDFLHVVVTISSYFLHDFTISSHFLCIFHFLRICFGTIHSIVVVIAPFSSYFRCDFTLFFVFSSRILLLRETSVRHPRDIRETSARHPRDIGLISDFGVQKSKFRNIFPATQNEDRATLPWGPATPH